MLPFVSIIIPVYNAVQFLDGCLASVFWQSWQDYEVLIVDDGSTDGSVAMCDRWEARDRRIHVFHQSNGGVSIARNKGLEEAKGEWVLFVDADDELYDADSLMRLVQCTDDNGIDLVMGGYELLDNGGNVLYSIDERVSERLTRREGIEQLYRPRHYRYQRYICSKLFKTSVIRQSAVAFDPAIHFNEDGLFLTHYLLAMKGEVSLFTHPVYKYYERTSSSMISIRERYNPLFVTDFYASLEMYQLLRREFHDRSLNAMARQELFKSYRMIHNFMYQFGAFDKALHCKLNRMLICNVPWTALLREKVEHKQR